MYNFHYVAMDFTKTQKSKYLENEFLFFFSNNYTRATLW